MNGVEALLVSGFYLTDRAWEEEGFYQPDLSDFSEGVVKGEGTGEKGVILTGQ